MSAPYDPQLPPAIASPADLLRRYGLHPDKSLGQNYLSDPKILEEIVQAAEVNPTDTILEIGPGLGSLTSVLAWRASRVVAVELDQRLAPVLRQVLAPYDNVQLVLGDILALDPGALAGVSGYLVVANIPYYITSAVIRRLLESTPRPRRIVLTVQQEVAERLCARPGDLSLLALSVQVYGYPSIVAHIPAGAFYPSPKVDSAVVRVDLPSVPPFPQAALASFFHLAKAAFSQKRKTLRNTFSAGLRITPQQARALLDEAGIDANRRAETVSLDEWKKLVNAFQPLLMGVRLPKENNQHSSQDAQESIDQ